MCSAPISLDRLGTVTPRLRSGSLSGVEGSEAEPHRDGLKGERCARKIDGRIRRSIQQSSKEAAIAKVLRCRDLGMNCPKEIRAETEAELLSLAAEHAEKDHGISPSSIPPSILAMVKAAIKDEA